MIPEKTKIFFSGIFLCLVLPVAGQQFVPLSYGEYMEKVISGNLGYAAEQLKVEISDAKLTASEVFNDPSLAVRYYNNENKNLQMGEGFEWELSKTFSIGKRNAGVRLARSEKELSQAALADFLRHLRAEATIAYMEALKQTELYRVKQESYQDFRELAAGDSLRFVLGKINEIDAIQSRVEAGIIYNELLQVKADLRNSFSGLHLLTGTLTKDTLFRPVSELYLEPRIFVLSELLSAAEANRTDMAVAQRSKELASNELLVARRRKNPDIDLSLGVSKNARVYNNEAPAPPFTGITAGVAVPLKFSNFNRGTVRAAQLQVEQTEMQYRQLRLQVQTEVIQAYRNYQSLTEQLNRFETDMLEKAKDVLDGKRYSHQRGDISLLEVLDAQRTYNDVKVRYIETLFNYCVALAELEKSAGIWDIHLK